MPTFQLNTNVKVDDHDALLKALTKLMMDLTGKPEQYVMVMIRDELPMCFGGDSKAPCAYVMLLSVGGFKDNKKASAKVCELLQAQVNIPQNRIFIEFNGPDGGDFGWNGSTF